MELGELSAKFYTCDDGLPHFAMLLGGMLMVKMGVSDRQHSAAAEKGEKFHKPHQTLMRKVLSGNLPWVLS